MHINYVAILLATVAQFIVGAIWYTPLFGRLWGKIHGFDKLPKATQKKMMSMMPAMLGIQFITTILTSFVLYLFIAYQPSWNAYAMAGFLWLGFVVPTQVSAVIFGNTEPKWVITKIAIMAGASILCLEAAAIVLRMML